MKCDKCLREITGGSYQGLCYSCSMEKDIAEYKPIDRDDDLRDEVAKAAMQGILSNSETSLRATFEDIAKEAFDYSDAWMTERARRREGR